MKILDNISPEFDREELMERLHLKEDSARAKDFDELLEEMESIAQPKGVYKASYVTNRKRDGIEIDGVEFESRVLRKNLEKVERVFPYIVTCGKELDEIDPGNSYLKSYWLDEIKKDVLTSASEKLHEEIEEKYNLEKIATMNPGSANVGVWPIEEQEKLFSIFDDVKELIGVELTEGYQMIPKKSGSGIIFPTEFDYVNCQLCEREDCPSRRADYDLQMAKEYGLIEE